MIKSLNKETDLLLEWLSNSIEIPAIGNKLVVVDCFERRTIDNFEYSIIHSDKIYPVKDFEKAFDDLLHKGYGWINLHCAGIYQKNIIFTLELPHTSSSIPYGKTSINYSGPGMNPFNKKPEWNFEFFYKII